VKARWLACAFLSCAALVGASELKPDQTVLFFSGIGSAEATGWQLDLHGWVYESHYLKPVTSLLRKSLGIRDEELTPAELATFRQRAQFFLVDNERHKAVEVQMGQMRFKLSSSLPNGHFQTNIHILNEDIERFGLKTLLSSNKLEFQTLPSRKHQETTSGEILLIPETGISVISDIDDTIKHTEVLNHRELLRNTFCRPYEAIPGMASRFTGWETAEGACFHYVSATPWQLSVPLTAFLRERGFPEGSLHLKTFRWKDQTFFDLFQSPERYKARTIEPILNRFPLRQFVLVGDSGEKDPEIYAALARGYPNQIARIFIRNITGETREAKRYETVFTGLATNLWQVFENASELPTNLRGRP